MPNPLINATKFLLALTGSQPGAGPPAGASEFLNRILASRTVPYAESDKVTIREQLLTLVKSFPNLRLGTSSYVFNDGHEAYLLKAEGTVPMNYQGGVYNIPVEFWLPEVFPRAPPIAFVRPTPTMEVSPRHSFVDPSGAAHPAALVNWRYPRSTLEILAKEMSDSFGIEPPLYTRRPGGGGATSASSPGAAGPGTQPMQPPPQPSPGPVSYPVASIYSNPMAAAGSPQPPPPSQTANGPPIWGQRAPTGPDVFGEPPGQPGGRQFYPGPQTGPAAVNQVSPARPGPSAAPPGRYPGPPPPDGSPGSSGRPGQGGPPPPPPPPPPPLSGNGPSWGRQDSKEQAVILEAKKQRVAQMRSEFAAAARARLKDELKACLAAYDEGKAAELSEALDVQRRAEDRHDQLAAAVAALDKERADLEGAVRELGLRGPELRAWLQEHEGRAPEGPDSMDVDEYLRQRGDAARAALELQAEDQAHEDALEVLERALGKVGVDGSLYLRQIRQLSRQQLFVRLRLGKAMQALGPPQQQPPPAQYGQRPMTQQQQQMQQFQQQQGGQLYPGVAPGAGGGGQGQGGRPISYLPPGQAASVAAGPVSYPPLPYALPTGPTVWQQRP